MKLQGIFIDTTTPFDHAGELYRVKIEHNIAKWNQTSVAGYAVGGFAGEGALLASDEKVELWKLAAQHAAPEKLLIAGIDAEGVREAASQANAAAALKFSAVLVESPTRRDLQLLFHRSVADRSPIPILISNRRAELTGETLAALSQHPNIAGIVDHSGKCAPSLDFQVLCGAESALWTALARGAAGAILPFASAAPYTCIALWEAFRTREEDAGLDWQSRITPAAALLNERYGVPGLKHAMDLNGYYGGPPRLPWSSIAPAAKREIEHAFADLKS